MKKRSINNLFNLTSIFISLLGIAIIVEVFSGYPNKIGNTLFALAVLLCSWFLLQKSRFMLPRTIYNLIVIFIFLAMFLGKVCGFYKTFYYWDKFLHLISGMILACIGYLIFYKLTREIDRKSLNPLLGVLFSLFFSITMAGVWEIYEFTTDQLFGLDSQRYSLIDTMGDIIAGAIGGILVTLRIYFFQKGNELRFIQKLLNEIDDK
ncbi:hypothetical protein [Clostridium sp. 'White wine YQ']|uniref:hypothetical protein n=1 Tax=Clostridium sp. 'White wine YQ' TaxID=3027474 RepID=UPI002366495D|nr:hypothetical protein [Clostridium sp. 'White wine YQ']MDD7792844.1 hypothetical protein [Clostridium sp. 'White wine YQ']